MTTKPYNKDNLILIGMPGAGKSTIGIVLAKIIGYTFIDSDIIIQNEKNMYWFRFPMENKGAPSFFISEPLCPKDD